MKFIINLNGSVICPYQALLDIAAQIPNVTAKILQLAFDPISDLDNSNDWINLESLGKPVAIRAKQLTDIMVAHLQKSSIEQLQLAVYLSDGPLTADNLYSFIYLAAAMPLEIHFYTHHNTMLLVKSSTAFLKTISTISLYYEKQDTVADDEVMLVLKSVRAEVLKHWGFSFEEQFLRKSQIFDSQINQLIGYAWMCLKAGAFDTACNLMQAVLDHPGTSKLMHEHVFMHLLMLRFFSHQYDVVTHMPFPEQFETLEFFEVKTMQFLMAYSATLDRNLPLAETYFKLCGIHADLPLEAENILYQLNIFALFKMLAGDMRAAEALGQKIQAGIEALHSDSIGLKWVNYTNLARVYKRMCEYDKSIAYYQKAYSEISDGGYTSSDHIHYNLNLGSLYEAKGDNKSALLYWVKTALHWLALKNPYELAWTVRLVLCQEQLADINQPLVADKVHRFLHAKINALLKSCKMKLIKKPLKTYQFIEDLVNLRREQCFIYHNIMIYSGQLSKNLPANPLSGSGQQLAGLISQYLHTIMDLPDEEQIIIVDTHLDTHVIANAEQAMAFAHVSNCSSCYFNGQWIRIDSLEQLQPMAASLSKVIASIATTEDGLVIHYKRSFLNKMLHEPGEIDLVNQLKQMPYLQLDRITNSMWNNVHQLAKKRILRFNYPPTQ